jgi:hypothetical protein
LFSSHRQTSHAGALPALAEAVAVRRDADGAVASAFVARRECESIVSSNQWRARRIRREAACTQYDHGSSVRRVAQNIQKSAKCIAFSRHLKISEKMIAQNTPSDFYIYVQNNAQILHEIDNQQCGSKHITAQQSI